MKAKERGLSRALRSPAAGGSAAPCTAAPCVSNQIVPDWRTTVIDIQKLARISPWNPDHALEADDKALQEHLSFTDKATYLEWRAEWREDYRDLSARIRSTRALWRAEGQNHEPAMTNALLAERALARTMLALRKASKVRAEQLYQEAKAQAQVA